MDLIERQDAIDAIDEAWTRWDVTTIDQLRDKLHELFLVIPSAQPEPLLDEIVDEIRKTIAETESNGKYHADSVRHNGEMICHGLEIALIIIEEKRNERSD